MKHIVLLFFFTTSLSAYAQNWKLNNVDKTKEYGFEYIFSFQGDNIKSKIKIAEKENSKRTELSGQVLDNLNNPISAASIKIVSMNETLQKDLKADFKGDFRTELPPGMYSIEINYPGFERFRSQVVIRENYSIDLKINLGPEQELRIYQINSKKELAEGEIFQIITCIDTKRKLKNFSTTDCSEKDKYQVTIQI